MIILPCVIAELLIDINIYNHLFCRILRLLSRQDPKCIDVNQPSGK